ncbi:MAG: metallophosphoesterase [Sphingomicrobium sp.]
MPVLTSRLSRLTLLILAGFWLGLSTLSAAPKAPDAKRIVAVGDLHGDYSAWLAIARDAGLIDASNHWSGGPSTLVQLGDIADRGPNTLKIIRHLQQLEREALKTGGKVVVVLGNHEAMNLIGDLRYATAAEFTAFANAQSRARRDAFFAENRDSILKAYRANDAKLSEAAIRGAWIAKTPLGWVEHRLAWSPSGEIGLWAARNPAIVKLGTYLFAHGGISAETAERSIGTVNRDIARAMAKADSSDSSPLEDPLGPLWYRGLLGRDLDAEATRLSQPRSKALSPAAEVDSVLASYGAKHIVVGHTPNLKGITILYGGKLARIDTGISHHYNGAVSWLEIVGETMTPHVVRRPAP